MEGGMDYVRPKTIDEALELLVDGIPLAGGTQLTAERYKLTNWNYQDSILKEKWI